jgi:hypothetical protein
MRMPKRYEDYLKQFDAALGKTGANDRDDITREIESHLALAAQRGPSGLDDAIAELGPPMALAEAYRLALNIPKSANGSVLSEVLRVAAGRARARAFVIRSIMLTGLLLLLAAIFASLALLQPFAPQDLPGFIGKFMLGGLARTTQGTTMLGWSLTVLGGALAVGSLFAASTQARHAWRRLILTKAALAT